MTDVVGDADRLADEDEVVHRTRRALLRTCGGIRALVSSLRDARKRFDQGQWPEELDWPRNRRELTEHLGLPPHLMRRRLASGWCGLLDSLTAILPRWWDDVAGARAALDDVAAWIADAGCTSDDRWTLSLRRNLRALEAFPIILTQPPAGSIHNLPTMLQHLRSPDFERGYPLELNRVDAMLAGAAEQMTEIQTPFEWCRQGTRQRASAGTSWRDVQRRLLVLCDQGEAYTSIGKLAKGLGCAKPTAQKAINNSATLRDWQARHTQSKRAPRATSITEMVMDNTEQVREADPALAAEGDDVDLMFARLIQEAPPEERAELNQMDVAQRRRIIALLRNDPDNYDRILDRKA